MVLVFDLLVSGSEREGKDVRKVGADFVSCVALPRDRDRSIEGLFRSRLLSFRRSILSTRSGRANMEFGA